MKNLSVFLFFFISFTGFSQTCNYTVNPLGICPGQNATLSVQAPAFSCSTSLPANLQTSLAAYYPFCGNANDMSGNGNHGTVSGAVLTADRFGNASSSYSFNGSNSSITVPHSSALTHSNNALSISLWTKISAWPINSQEYYLLAKHSGTGSTQSGYHMYVYGSNNINDPLNQLAYRYKNGNPSPWGSAAVATNSLPVPGNWFHVLITTDNSLDKMYINGVLSYTAASQIIGANTNSLTIGYDAVGGQYWNGWIDDIAIYNRTLNASEAQQLYGLGIKTYSWSQGPTTNSVTVNPSVTATYTVNASNGYTSCSAQITLTVAPLALNVNTSRPLMCVGETATLTAGGATNYTWTPGGTGVTLAVSPTVTTDYTLTGLNSVTGCSNTIVHTQSVSLCTGAEENGMLLISDIFPNPVNEELTVTAETEGAELFISSCEGKLIQHRELIRGTNSFDTESIPPGLYFYSVKKNGSTLRRGKLIKD